MTTARQHPQLTVLVDPAGHPVLDPVLDPGRLAPPLGLGFRGLPRVRWLVALPTIGGQVAPGSALVDPTGAVVIGGAPVHIGRLLVAAPT